MSMSSLSLLVLFLNLITLEKKKLTLYYLFRFVDETDATIANLIFNEMVDAKRDINNSPGFTIIDLRKIPSTLVNAFPDEEWPDEKEKAFLLNISNTNSFIIF